VAAFKGVVVDWRRGTVSFGGKAGQELTLRPGFWRDVRWWVNHLHTHSFTTTDKDTSRGELVLAGTDASDWGTGQVIWRDGGREEYQLEFTRAERRRPINWRELLGIVRACRLCGERARGATVLVEADNMAAVGATRKLASKAEDMQALVRQLLRLSRRHGFRLKVTHTPGEKLDRPDQTSRGDAAEEPRARVDRPMFERIAARAGGFSSFLGAEREHGLLGSSQGPSTVAWAHPTYNTVGTALRRVGELLGGGGQNRSSAMALVPNDPTAKWNSMMRHGVVVGRFRAGESGVEANVMGEWRPSLFRRPTQLVLFPRAAGSHPRRVSLSFREALDVAGGRVEGGPQGYTLSADGTRFELAVLPGSFVYSRPYGGKSIGVLYRVCAGPRGGHAEGLHAQELERASTRAAKHAVGKRGIPFEVRLDATIHRPNPAELWAVDGFIGDAGGGRTFERYAFNAAEAHVEIEKRAAGPAGPDTSGWDMGSSVAASPQGHNHPRSPFEPYKDFVMVQPEPDNAGSPSGSVPTAESLEQVVAELDALSLQRSAVNRGPEGKLPDQSTSRGSEAAPRKGTAQARWPNHAVMRP
jgi:hypothetical protein